MTVDRSGGAAASRTPQPDDNRETAEDPPARLERVSEDELVAVFLAGELSSPRFGARLRSLIRDAALDPDLVLATDTRDPWANARRRELLGRFRGWPDREVFEGLPRDTAWFRAVLPTASVLAARYMDYSYWRELSGGTRLVADGVARVRAGVTAFDVGNEPFHALAHDLERGAAVPPLVLVGTDPAGPLTVLEGHARATALGLARPELRPPEVSVLLGVSPRMDAWARPLP